MCIVSHTHTLRIAICIVLQIFCLLNQITFCIVLNAGPKVGDIYTQNGNGKSSRQLNNRNNRLICIANEWQFLKNVKWCINRIRPSPFLSFGFDMFQVRGT